MWVAITTFEFAVLCDVDESAAIHSQRRVKVRFLVLCRGGPIGAPPMTPIKGLLIRTHKQLVFSLIAEGPMCL